MGIGTSAVVIAIEVDSSEGFNINTIGIILMIVGAVGLVFTALVWGPRRRAAGVVVERETVVR